jgi:O-antigen ligase
MAAALILNLTGVVLTLSRGAILLSAALLVAGMIYAFTFLWPVISGATKLRTLVVALLVAGVAAFLFFAAYPQNAVRRELATLSTLPKLREAFVGDRVPLFDAAWRIWKDHPWAGVGGWGFRRFAGLYLKPDEWDLLRKHGKANVHNDPLQFLCEHGVVGMGLILATAVILIVPIFMRLKAAIRPPGGEEFAEKPFIIRVSPLVWALMGGTFCVFLYSLVDLPFRSPAVLYPWAVCLATASGMIPRLKWRAAGADASRRARHVERGASGAGDEGDGEESRRSRADEA